MGNVKKNRWVIIKDGEVIEPPPEKYYADPFVLEDILFFEYYDYDKGVIAILKDGKPEVVLEKPYHLSFPCVFKDNGSYYMLPETVNNNQLELYKAKNFPYDWELVKVIAQGWYDDPIMYVNSRYTIFTTEGANNLKVLQSDALTGEYSTIYTDASKQYRSAGQIFTHNGRTIRPVQNCEGSYGKGIIFYELEGFNHRELSRFNLDSPFTGCHTFNSGFIDARFPYETTLDSIKQNPDIRRPVPYTD